MVGIPSKEWPFTKSACCPESGAGNGGMREDAVDLVNDVLHGYHVYRKGLFHIALFKYLLSGSLHICPRPPIESGGR